MRKPLLALLVVCLLLVGVMGWLLVPRRSRVTRENYQRITVGMSRAAVEETLGGPPGDYRNGPSFLPDPRQLQLKRFQTLEAYREVRYWEGDMGIVGVVFADDGEALWAEFFDAKPVEVSTLELFRWRLNRRWERLWGK
jgi:hypothetical protein